MLIYLTVILLLTLTNQKTHTPFSRGLMGLTPREILKQDMESDARLTILPKIESKLKEIKEFITELYDKLSHLRGV